MSVNMSLEYTGELGCRLIHGPSGSVLPTDAPKDNAGRGAAFSPTDLVGAALLSCAVTTMAIKARQEGIPFTTARGAVEKEMSKSPPRRVARLTLRVELPASLGPAERSRLEEIARGCPVALSLGTEVEQRFSFHYV